MPSEIWLLFFKLVQILTVKNCCSELEKPDETLYSMLSDKVHLLPCHIQTAYLQNMMKVVSIILSKRDTQQSIEVYF